MTATRKPESVPPNLTDHPPHTLIDLPGGLDDPLDRQQLAIERLERAHDRHVAVSEEADDLEEQMPQAREDAIARLIAAGKTPSAAEKQPGADAEYTKLRDRRRILTRQKQRAEYAVLAASRRVTLAEERARLARVRESVAEAQADSARVEAMVEQMRRDFDAGGARTGGPTRG